MRISDWSSDVCSSDLPGLLLLSFDHRLDDDVDATIARLIDIVGGADQRLALSAPFGANAVARHTLARQIGGHRIGPALRQAHVVFVTAGRVGMADDMNDRLVIALENAGNLRVRIQRIRAQLRAVQIEAYIADRERVGSGKMCYS